MQWLSQHKWRLDYLSPALGTDHLAYFSKNMPLRKMTHLLDEMALWLCDHMTIWLCDSPLGLLVDKEQMELCVQHRGLTFVVRAQPCLSFWILSVATLPISPLNQLTSCLCGSICSTGWGQSKGSGPQWIPVTEVSEKVARGRKLENPILAGFLWFPKALFRIFGAHRGWG